MADSYLPTIVSTTENHSGPRIRLRFLSGSRSGQEEAHMAALVLGRGDDCSIAFDHTADFMVSSRHAQVSLEGRNLWVEDLGSRNGTFVNRQRITGRVSVRTGDRVCLGPPDSLGTVQFMVAIDGEMPAAGDDGPLPRIPLFAGPPLAESDRGISTRSLPETGILPGFPESSPPPPLQTSSRGTVGGLVDGVKRFFLNVKERRDLQRALRELDQLTQGLQDDSQKASRALGRAAWSASFVASTLCDAAAEVFRTQGELEKLKAISGEAEQVMEQVTATHEAWLLNWKTEHGALEQTAQGRESDRQRRMQERQVAEQHVRALVRERLASMERTVRQLNDCVRDQGKEVSCDFERVCQTLHQTVLESLQTLSEPISGLDEALSVQNVAREIAEQADRDAAIAAQNVRNSLKLKSEKDSSLQHELQEKRKQCDDAKRTAERCDSSLDEPYSQIGVLLIDSTDSRIRSLTEWQTAASALASLRQHEWQEQETRRRLLELG